MYNQSVSSKIQTLRQSQGPILIDTDACTDVDDFLAIAFLIKAMPDSIKLISTTYGPVELRAKSVRTLLNSMNHFVPVIEGSKSLLTDNKDVWLAGNEDFLYDESLNDDTSDLLESYLKYDDFTVLALGPLTNIALLLKSPVFVQRCKRIVIMGGTISPDGIIPDIEHNFKCDPVATKLVMESSVPKVLIPVDLTLQFPMSDEHQDMFKRTSSSYGKLLACWISIWRSTSVNFEGPFHDSVHWHDPIAAAYLTHPELFSVEKMSFTVDDNGALSPGSHEALVCTRMNPKIIDILIDTILDKPAVRPELSVSVIDA